MTHTTTLRRHGTPTKRAERGIAPVTLSALHPAHRSGRSLFPSRVFDPDEVARVLKDGHQSRKIGKTVTKGPRRGWPIFTLTLEERATCPRTCKAWSFCYGNSMQAAERIVAGEQLIGGLWPRIGGLQGQHPGGFMVRLHVLGDFYSEDYVRFWTSALEQFPALHVFGFTARLPGTPSATCCSTLASSQWSRFAVRFSGMVGPMLGSILQGDDGTDQAVPCPAQTGAAECCAACALCWHSQRSISFARH
jgi:hypothetical protein